MRAIDLFAGIGGFRVALERQGHEVVFSSEIDSRAQAVYEANFGERPAGDIVQIAATDIPPHDILCGGFPCQPFSISGNKKGFADERGELFFEIIRIAKHHKPSLMLLENVPAITSTGGGKVFADILSALKEIGYYTQPLLLNAAHYGYAQNRIRVYFVCTRKKMMPIKIWPRDAGNTLSMFLERDVDERWFVDPKGWIIDCDKIPKQPQRRIVRVGYKNKGGQGYRLCHPLGYATTVLVSGRQECYYIDGRIRGLNHMETKRIMGFPDDYTISEGKRGIGQLGNAVIPGMIELLLEQAIQ